MVAVNLPTGDYWIEFIDHQGEQIPRAVAATATLRQAREIAAAYSLNGNAARWRILRVVAQSTDGPHGDADGQG